MALASQSGSRGLPLGRRPHTNWRSSRRRRTRTRLFFGSFALLVIVGGLYLILRPSGGGEEVAGVGESTQIGGGDGSQPAAEPAGVEGVEGVAGSEESGRPPARPLGERAQEPAGEEPIVQDPDPEPEGVEVDREPAREEPAPAEPTTAAVRTLFDDARRALADSDPVRARALLNRVLLHPRASSSDADSARAQMRELNGSLVFSRDVFAGDELSTTYTVRPGDSLSRIRSTLSLSTEPEFIATVNLLANANAIRVGQRLKIVPGPFHAVVSKSDYRIDIYAGPKPDPANLDPAPNVSHAEPGWTYVTSYLVGLGENDQTPVGNFLVTRKVRDPEWTNPRTGKRYTRDDPENPIGSAWLALEGLDAESRKHLSYGIHGTIEPETIGTQSSMGCIRLGDDDVEMVYQMLGSGVSVVKIRP